MEEGCLHFRDREAFSGGEKGTKRAGEGIETFFAGRGINAKTRQWRACVASACIRKSSRGDYLSELLVRVTG